MIPNLISTKLSYLLRSCSIMLQIISCHTFRYYFFIKKTVPPMFNLKQFENIIFHSSLRKSRFNEFSLFLSKLGKIIFPRTTAPNDNSRQPHSIQLQYVYSLHLVYLLYVPANSSKQLQHFPVSVVPWQCFLRHTNN